jgi:hypothetical protein
MSQPHLPKQISIITSHSEGERAMFPSAKAVMMRAQQFSADMIKSNLAEAVGTLGDLFAALPGDCGGYTPEQVTVTLSIDASGKVPLVGEIAAGITSGISICFTRAKD